MSARLIGPEVERQLRNWELARTQRRAAEARVGPPEVQEFVTISRSLGSGGSEVARRLAERLGWSVFDKEILHAMAGDDGMRERLYQEMDERDMGWIESMLRYLFRGQSNPHDSFSRLAKTVLTLARGGHAVFLGRGADLILPGERGLRVRIDAPRPQRVEAFAAREEINPEDAEKAIDKIERERAEFLRRLFPGDLSDVERFDLTINLGRFDIDQAVGLIESAMRLRNMLD